MCRPQSAVSTPAGVRAPSQVVPLMPGWRQDAPWPPLLSLLACDFHVGSGWCTGIYEEAGHTEEGGGSRVNRAERDNCHKIPWCLNTALQWHLNLEKLQPVTHLPMILSLCLRTRHWLPSHGGKRPPPQTHTHTHARTQARLPSPCPHTSLAGARVHLKASVAAVPWLDHVPSTLHLPSDMTAQQGLPGPSFSASPPPALGAPLTFQRLPPPHTLFWVHQCPHKPTATWNHVTPSGERAFRCTRLGQGHVEEGACKERGATDTGKVPCGDGRPGAEDAGTPRNGRSKGQVCPQSPRTAREQGPGV